MERSGRVAIVTTSTRRAARPTSAEPPQPSTGGTTDAAVLAQVGLRRGEAVRFRRNGAGRWVHGRIAAVAADGSITLHDGNGAARSLRPERLEVRRPSPRGTLSWHNVADVAVTWEQLCLW